MKTPLVVLLANLASIIMAVGAVWIAVEGLDGWGWFIFAALCLGATEIKLNSAKNQDK